ncbi:MAG: hypothetical protein JXB13_06500 [Phycisphaerae bacterium]|nr:hypothetical protein [Phycisphaerae bacterium]
MSDHPSPIRIAILCSRLAVLAALIILCGMTALQAGKAPAGTAPEDIYGLYVLTPALVAIGLAVVTAQVLPALAMAVLTAAAMLLPCLPADARYGETNGAVAAVRVAVETYVVGAMTDIDHIKIIVFTLTIGGMVGVIGANGGTTALVALVAGRARGRRAGQLVAWLAGLLVFFDDYANSMIVGPTLQPVFDRLRLSRAKLSYIVDSTAAPVASIALIGTWIGAEIGYIQDGLDELARLGTPACVADVTAYQAFLQSLPYRFYPIFALVLVGLLAGMGRDFGPMLGAERSAVNVSAPMAVETTVRRWRGWLAAIPVLILVTGTIAIILITGMRAVPADESATAQAVLSGADAFGSILYAAIASLAIAALLGITTRANTLARTMEATLEGMARMLPAVVVLVLAWALSKSTSDLRLGAVATSFLQGEDVKLTWLPLLIFLAAAGVSLATGTSWGTMAILCPVAVEVAGRLVADLPPDAAHRVFYASVGAVLAGAIFGDHCSPISDTTVLSAAASGCRLEEHVWTQAPYALAACVVAVLAGNVLCTWWGLPAWLCIGVGVILLAGVVRALGRRT